MLDDQINPVHTPCKDCVFAVYENKTQEGCALGYIDKYNLNNTKILEAYDNEKEFYIINGKKCIGYRENKWFKQFNLENAELSDKLDKYHEMNHLDYMVVVNLQSISVSDLDDVLQQIASCDIQPKKLILIRYANHEIKLSYSDIEELFKKYNIPYSWRIQTILDDTLTQDQILHNTVSLNSKYRFVLFVSSYNNQIKNIVEQTNKIVHHDLSQFDVISNKDHSCKIFSSVIYRFESFHGKDLLKNIDSYTIV